MPETRLRQRFFKQFRPTYTYSYMSEKFCCTEIILHCVSVSKQLQQWTNFCTNFSPKKWGKWGSRPPLSKKAEGRRPPAPLHPWCGQQWDRGRLKNRPDRASLVPCKDAVGRRWLVATSASAAVRLPACSRSALC